MKEEKDSGQIAIELKNEAFYCPFYFFKALYRVFLTPAPYYSGCGRGFRVIRELTGKQCESEKLMKDSRDS